MQKPRYVAHEMLHQLGLLHEHQRPDRDSYIRVSRKTSSTAIKYALLQILWPNLPERFRVYFDKYGGYGGDTHGTSYDFQSIMHYAPVVCLGASH